MGLISSSLKGETPDIENDPQKKEEDYERLFMKIGRDFVHRDDLTRIFNQFTARLALTNPLIALAFADDAPDASQNSGAMAQAAIYKSILDRGEDGSKRFEDLIDLSE